MRTLTIAKRELANYFKSPIAYIVLGVFLVLAMGMFFAFGGFFDSGQAGMEGFFGNMPFLFLFFGPAIAMRLIAEERGSGTIELLLTMPVRDWEVVAGKFLAALGLLAVGLLLTTPAAYTVSKLGPMDWGPALSGYVGALCLGGLYLSIGLFASALTRNQVVAFLVGLLICVFLFLMTRLSSELPSWLARIVEYMSPQFHFVSIQRGVIELRNIVYYASVTATMLVLTVLVLESRKWR